MVRRKSNPKSLNVSRQSSFRNSRSSSRNTIKKSKQKSRPGVVTLRQIRLLQKTTNLLIPRLSFSRVVKEIMNNFSFHQLRLQTAALLALQEAAEMFMINLFQDALLCANHAKRVTLYQQDLFLVKRLRGAGDVANPQ